MRCYVRIALMVVCGVFTTVAARGTGETMNPREGSATLWVCLKDGQPPAGRCDLFTVLASDGKPAVRFWLDGSRLYGTACDTRTVTARAGIGSYLTGRHQYAFSWDRFGVRMYIDGRAVVMPDDAGSPMKTALRPPQPLRFDVTPTRQYRLGEKFPGTLSDVVLRDKPLTLSEARAVFFAEGGKWVNPDYASLYRGLENRHYGRLRTRLHAEVKFPSVPSDTNAFRAVGPVRIGQANGTSYLEAGDRPNDRFAVRLSYPPRAELCVVEIDYPDDKERMIDFQLQDLGGGSAPMQVGVFTGGDLPLTGRVLTHRCLYWNNGGASGALVAMTSRRKGSPAAVAAVRVYEVLDGLPPLDVKDAAPVNGNGRTFAVYFEDPAVSVAMRGGKGGTDAMDPRQSVDIPHRLAAIMKFTGQNALFYPGVWYQGLIGEDYITRSHPVDYLTQWYTVFDREGLSVMPTVNMHNYPATVEITAASFTNGSLYATPAAIMSDGRPNPGGWHGSPPNWNISHPELQRYLENAFDRMIAQGRHHPSFKGIVIDLSGHVTTWWGSLKCGYNDYSVTAFRRATGIAVPEYPDDPLRGKAYCQWLMANAREAWIQWRCDVLTDLYARLAAKLAAARPDLRFYVNARSSCHQRNLGVPDMLRQRLREGGIDAKGLSARIPNLVFLQKIQQSNYRRMGPDPKLDALRCGWADSAAAYLPLEDVTCPAVCLSDPYYESAIGKHAKPNTPAAISCHWITERGWRVSVMNPGGEMARRPFVAPFRHHDVQVIAKGGYLIGTYGLEEAIRPFVQAFRALPAVVFDTWTEEGPVVTRRKEYAGRIWMYAVNASSAPRSVRIAFPAGTKDLVSGKTFSGATEISLPAWGFRSFVK